MGLLTGLAGGIALLLFFTPDALAVAKRLPGASNEPVQTETAVSQSVPTEKVNLEGVFEALDGSPGKTVSSWPRFRGAEFNNISLNAGSILENWPPGGPPVLWSLKLSEGHSGPAVWKGRVYIMDYDETREGDVLRCFSFENGREIWRRWYKAPTKRNHGVSRTVPAVTEKYTVTMGPRCHVLCVDTETGAFRWGIDLAGDFGATVPLWYTGQCPLIDDGVAVLAPAGKSLMIGVDCDTGKVLWEAPNPSGLKMSHSSIIPMTLAGKRTYVYGALGGAVGVSAEPGDRGAILWTVKEWNNSVLSPSPVQVDDRRFFLTSGYGGGSMMLEVTRENDSFSAKPLFELEKTTFSCEQQTPVFYRGYLFGILPKDASALRGQFVCLDTEGKIRWASGKTERFGLGPFLFAQDKVLILNDTGELTLIRASLDGYEQLARARVLHGRDAWAPMALVDGRLLLRDSENLICLDLRTK
ncbi:MAG: outer membrane protein assembly factor BamB family protein [Limisphaerales bacterium]